jgi:2-iminoacetate synthase ThiH
MTPNIADHFDMPDAEQAGDKAEQGYYTEEQVKAAVRQAGSEQAKQATFVGGLGSGYQVDRTYAMMNVIQQLDQVHRTLDHLQLPSIAAILNEAITALGTQWLDERKP